MRIGNMANLMGIQPETIRYYEKEGLISPKRKQGSTFREYSIWDVFDLSECKKYREMDFSINDVKKLRKAASFEEISRLFEGKYEELLEVANNKILLAEEVKDLKDRVENAHLNIGNYWFATEPEKVGICFTERTGKDYSEIDIKNSTIKAWIKNYLHIYGYMLVSVNDLVNGLDKNRWAYVINRKNVDLLGLPLENCFVLESKRYLHTVIDIGEKESLNIEMLRPVMDYLNEKSLKVQGDIIGYLMIRSYIKGIYHRFVEIMVPVE